MLEWNKTENVLPEKNKWVEVKDPLVDNETSHALLIDTECGTTEWLYCGIINMAIDLIKEWREIEEENG